MREGGRERERQRVRKICIYREKDLRCFPDFGRSMLASEYKL